MTSDLQHQKVVALSNSWLLGSNIYQRSLLYCCCYTVLWISYFQTESSDTVNNNIQWLVIQLNLGTEKENKDDKAVNTQSIKKGDFWGCFASWFFCQVFQLTQKVTITDTVIRLYSWNTNTPYLKNEPWKSKTENIFKGLIKKNYFNRKFTNRTQKEKQVKEDRKRSESQVV